MLYDFDNLTAPIVIEDPNMEQPEDLEPELGTESTDSGEEEDGSVKEVVEDKGQAPKESEEPKTEEDWQKKFKTPEELFKAYKALDQSYNNIRPEFTKRTQELANLKKATSQALATSELPTEVSSAEDVINLITKAVEIKTNEAVSPIREKSEMMELENLINKFARTNQDFDDYAEDVLKVLEDSPYLWEGGSEKAIANAYKIAKSEKINESVEGIVARTLADKDRINAIKQKTQAQRVKASPPPEQEKTPEDSLADEILSVSKKSSSFFNF